MSRKARQDRTGWKTPTVYAFSAGYGPLKIRRNEPIDGALVWLTCAEDNEADDQHRRHHVMYHTASQVQTLLLRRQQQSSDLPFSKVIVIQAYDMVTDDAELQQALECEASELELCKSFGKTLLRLLQRLRLQNAILSADREMCPTAFKLFVALQKSNPNTSQQLLFLYPSLSAGFVNTHLVTYGNQTSQKWSFGTALASQPQLHLVFDSKAAQDKRLDMLRNLMPAGSTCIVPHAASHLLLTACDHSSREHEEIGPPTKMADPPRTIPPYNQDYCNDVGQSLFVSSIQVQMSKHTKQYERLCQDITEEVGTAKCVPLPEDKNARMESTLVWSSAERQVGALVLRGNRCVLVRSLKGLWQGMRLPSVVPQPSESDADAAVRAVVDCIEVDADEVQHLPYIPPVAIYGPRGFPSTVVWLFAFYATQPPPDGPLEEADMEDGETPYDWYTLPRALSRLQDDPRSCNALYTMSLALVGAANAGLLPCKWGGVFGQETIVSTSSDLTSTGSTTSNLLTASVEKWQPSRRGDVMQDVRKR